MTWILDLDVDSWHRKFDRKMETVQVSSTTQKTSRVYIPTIYRQRIKWSTTCSSLLWSWRWIDKRKVTNRIRKRGKYQTKQFVFGISCCWQKNRKKPVVEMANQNDFFPNRRMNFQLFMHGLNRWIYADSRFAVAEAIDWQSNGLADLTMDFRASKTQARCPRHNSIEPIQSCRLDTNFRSVSRAMYPV